MRKCYIVMENIAFILLMSITIALKNFILILQVDFKNNDKLQ